jgi:hypothetical protein
MAPGQSATGPWVQVVGASNTGLPGLTTVKGTQSVYYVYNSGNISCSNTDVVINGTLFLKNANIYAEKGGCRLYVNGSVFIQGPITYLSSTGTADPTDNLQITSSKAILMGIGLKDSNNSSDSNIAADPLFDRLIGSPRNAVIRSAPTTTQYVNATYDSYGNPVPGTQSGWAAGVYAEGQNIGSTNLQDASVVTGLTSSQKEISWGDNQENREVINYNGLFLNAPVVQSRYLGQIKGVVVSEFSIFSLGSFNYVFDPVFTNTDVSILPALNYDILCSAASSSGCNPATGP